MASTAPASVEIRPGKGVFEPLRGGADPAPMGLLEFSQRAFERDGASFRGAPVKLTGFAAGTDAGGFRLARYQIACCAAVRRRLSFASSALRATRRLPISG